MNAINLPEKYFDMNKKQCRDALDLYKKFLIRMDRVGEFLKVAEVSYTICMWKQPIIIIIDVFFLYRMLALIKETYQIWQRYVHKYCLLSRYTVYKNLFNCLHLIIRIEELLTMSEKKN